MDLLEYQAKELFREIGIPTLPSQTIEDPRQIKQLQIPYPVVLKSQVRAGGRGKAGGVRFVSNTIDAIAATRTIFQLSILGEYPEVVLAEAHYNTKKEFFLAIVLDYQLKCPVLLGSAQGGMNVESLLANLQQVVVDDDFSMFYARRLTTRMGLSGNLIQSVGQIVEKMYRLFVTKDLDLIEINPLGVNSHGDLMALDGKITVNDSALFRHQEFTALNAVSKSSPSRSLSIPKPAEDALVSVKWLDWHDAQGQIAVVCNSYDLALLTWDLICQKQQHPASAVTISNNSLDESIAISDYGEKLQQILTKLISMPKIEVILLNIWDTEAISREIVCRVIDCATATLSQELKSKSEVKVASRQNSQSEMFPLGTKFVLRLLNREVAFTHEPSSEMNSGENQVITDSVSCTEDNSGFIYQPDEQFDPQKLAESIYITDSLTEAISQAVELVESE